MTKVKEIIFDRIVTEVFLGHNAIAVYIALLDHSSTLNALPFQQALGTIQRHALDAFVLSLCKLYEKPCKKYPNYSIPTTLALLQENLTGLADGIQNHVRLEQFIQTHVDPKFTVRDQENMRCIPVLILDHFSEQCPQTPPRDGKELDHILDALKVLRDKRVAHHEDADLTSLSKTDIDGALRLLAFAQTYINLVGYGFYGSFQEGVVDADKFGPSKSVIWSELNKMIKQLEQPPA